MATTAITVKCLPWFHDINEILKHKHMTRKCVFYFLLLPLSLPLLLTILPFSGNYAGQPVLAGTPERTGEFCWSKFYCLHALADGNQHIRIREKTPEFFSLVLPAPSTSVSTGDVVITPASLQTKFAREACHQTHSL